MKDIVSLLHAAITCDPQAAKEANDLFEDNGLPRVNFPRLRYVYTSNDFMQFMAVTDVLDSDQLFATTEEDLAVYYGINFYPDEPDDLKNWLDRANKWYDTCVKYHIKVTKVETPADWGFKKKDFKKVPELTEFFEKICTTQKNCWYRLDIIS